MGLQETFIRRGYIPKEFIPAFKSESLANALSIFKGGPSSYPQPESKCCYHSIPKLLQTGQFTISRCWLSNEISPCRISHNSTTSGCS
jgi:hypothetical protein